MIDLNKEKNLIQETYPFILSKDTREALAYSYHFTDSSLQCLILYTHSYNVLVQAYNSRIV